MRLHRRHYKDARGRRRRCATWCYDFVVRGVRYRGSTGLTDQVSASNWTTSYRIEVERRAAGFKVDPVDVAELPLPELVAEYVAELERRGRSASHQRNITTRILRLAAEVSVRTLRELDSRRITQALARLADRRALAPKTVAEYRSAVYALFSWLVRAGRWTQNPVEAVDRGSVVPRQRYRALEDDEVRRLLSVGPGHGGQTGTLWDRRRATYVMAVSTGLRASELAALRRGDVDLDRGVVRIPATHAKSRREESVPIPADAVEDLRPYLAPMLPGARPFRRPTQRTWRRDLARACIELDTPEGRIDFHGLRRTYSTRLARAGVLPALHQRLMRHTDPRLTLSVYTRLTLLDERGAARAIEGLIAGGESVSSVGAAGSA